MYDSGNDLPRGEPGAPFLTRTTYGSPLTGLRTDPRAIQLAPEPIVPCLTEVLTRTPNRYERVVKPLLDRFVAGILLVLMLPVLLAAALAVRAQLGPGVLYRQQRIGLRGAPFQMLKFRTMHHSRRRENRPFEGGDRRTRHKAVDDPRHTQLGRFLRRYSIDELPQLWHVVRGDLSLVGPRPELSQIVERYEPWQHARHLVKPGITGLWQVTERDHDGLMHRHVDTDLRYVAELSWRTDLRILALTIPTVLGLRSLGG